MQNKIRRIGILTGGGDCPGLNAVIRAVVKTAYNEYGIEVIGFMDGYEGLVEGRYRDLHVREISGLLAQGGTVLGTSNRADPFHYPALDGEKWMYQDRSEQCVRNFESLGIDALVAIGGDGTMAASSGLANKGIPIIGVPKTIDNDLDGTDVTFGFDSALSVATEAIDRIHTTAQSHHRVMLVEVMGRYAGWLALYSGMAAGGDIILIPEIPYDIDAVCNAVKKRSSSGKNFSIVIVGEGAKAFGGQMVVARRIQHSPDAIRLGGVSHQVAAQIEGITNIECRVTVLGHLLRGGSPSAFDRILATRFGVEAVHRIVKGETNRMISLRGMEITTVPISEVAGKTRLVTPSHPVVKAAVSLGVCLGNPPEVSIDEYYETTHAEQTTVATS